MQNKKNENNKHSSFGLLVGLLQITFVVLKLCKVIAWSWWWVLSPIWIYVLLVIIIGFFIGIVDAIIVIRRRKEYQKYRNDRKE